MVLPSQNQVCERFTSALRLGGILPTLIPLYNHHLIAAIPCLIYWLRLGYSAVQMLKIPLLNGICIDLNLPETILLALPVARTLTTLMACFPNGLHQSRNVPKFPGINFAASKY